MYFLKTEGHFDSAHFLYGYDGKCKNIHGHRWRIVVQIGAEALEEGGNERHMLVDFGTLKKDVEAAADALDHSLIIEEGSLKPATLAALADEDFKVIAVKFRPTAENFSKYFWDILKTKGYPLKSVEVYETPTNCAIYSEA